MIKQRRRILAVIARLLSIDAIIATFTSARMKGWHLLHTAVRSRTRPVLSLRPLTSRLLRRRIEDGAERVELAPTNLRYRPPALALPGELEGVTQFLDASGPSDPIAARCLEHLTEGEDLHPPTAAYLVKDALLADGCIYNWSALSVITKERRKPIIAGNIETVREAQLCTTHCGSVYFGDWLMVDLALEQLAHERGITPCSITNRTFPHEAGYRQRLQLPSVRYSSPLHVENLWIVDDNGMTENRIARYKTLRSRIRLPSSGTRRVFIDRGQWGAKREIRNRNEIIAALASKGFEIVSPESMTVDDLREVLSSASLCIGVEGSALCHAAMLMPEGGSILALVPHDRFVSAIKWFTDALGMRYAFAVMHNGQVDIDRLHATLDLI